MERDTAVIHTCREGAQVTARHYASADLLPSAGLSFSICTLGGWSLSASHLIIFRVGFTEVPSSLCFCSQRYLHLRA